MSGGRYKYFYIELQNLVGKINENIDQTNDNLEVINVKNDLMKIIEAITPAIKSLEWYDSGDISENTLSDDIKKAKESLKTILKVENDYE